MESKVFYYKWFMYDLLLSTLLAINFKIKLESTYVVLGVNKTDGLFLQIQHNYLSSTIWLARQLHIVHIDLNPYS